jgi:hypothetical protein
MVHATLVTAVIHTVHTPTRGYDGYPSPNVRY